MPTACHRVHTPCPLSTCLLAVAMDMLKSPSSDFLFTGTLKPPFVPALEHEGDCRHFGRITPSTDGGTDVGAATFNTEAVHCALARTSAFREF